MRRVSIYKDFLSRFFLLCPARWIFAVLFLLLNPATSLAADKIAVSPTAPYYSFIIYESLAIFWIAILCLIVIIRMKLREIERVQAMDVDKEDKDAPLLQ